MDCHSSEASEPPVPIFERQRLEALYSTNLLDGEPNARFDAITAKAAKEAGCPMALITLVDKHEVELKSSVGISSYRAKSRQSSLCSHAILLPANEVMVVLDTHLDRRFDEKSALSNQPYERFYAATPLATPDGHHIGNLCVLDTCPRSEFTMVQMEGLTSLAKEANHEISSVIDGRVRAQSNSIDVHIGRRIKQGRDLRQMSQAGLAGRLGISVMTLNRFETGQERVSAELLMKLRRVLGIPLRDIFRDL